MADKDKKEKKGGAGKAVGGVAVGAAAMAAVFMFLRGGDLGIGKGKNDTNAGEKPQAAVTTTTQAAEPAVTEVKFVDVTIKEDKYVYNGGEYVLDDLITELKKLTDGENVRINNDGGLADALDSLKKALDENGITYSDETAK
jgi:hypothetical protein